MNKGMKKIGLVGGLGPASTVYYYLGIIKRCQQQNGEKAYSKIVIDSADMSEHTEAFEKMITIRYADCSSKAFRT